MKAINPRFKTNAESLTNYLYLSPVFDENKREIIKRGLDAYLGEDHLVAAHLLIPQIEDGIRNLMEATGSPILRQGRDGSFQLKLLDELLREQHLSEILGDDAVFYLRILLTDPRGWNLRNRVSHGLLDHGSFGPEVTDRIIHALLFLALFRNRETSN